MVNPVPTETREGTRLPPKPTVVVTVTPLPTPFSGTTVTGTLFP